MAATKATYSLAKERKVVQWMPEEVEPSSPGCRPGVFPLDDGPNKCCEKDSNLQPRPSEGRARPIELSQRRFTAQTQLTPQPSFEPFRSCTRQASNLHAAG